MYPILFIHSLTEGYLSCLQVLGVMNKIAVVSVGKILCGNKFSFHLGIYQGAQLLDLMSLFSFEKKQTTKPSSKLAAFPPAVNESTYPYQH